MKITEDVLRARDITDTRDGRKFTAAGFRYLPAGGGMYSWQKHQGAIVLQACDWDTESPFYVVGALHDDGSTLFPHGEFGVDEALRELEVLSKVPFDRWETFVAGNPEHYGLT